MSQDETSPLSPQQQALLDAVGLVNKPGRGDRMREIYIVEAVSRALADGVDPNFVDAQGRSPCAHAFSNEQSNQKYGIADQANLTRKVLPLLIHHGANPMSLDNPISQYKGKFWLVDLFLKAGEKAHALRDDRGNNLLIIMAQGDRDSRAALERALDQYYRPSLSGAPPLPTPASLRNMVAERRPEDGASLLHVLWEETLRDYLAHPKVEPEDLDMRGEIAWSLTESLLILGLDLGLSNDQGIGADDRICQAMEQGAAAAPKEQTQQKFYKQILATAQRRALAGSTPPAANKSKSGTRL